MKIKKSILLALICFIAAAHATAHAAGYDDRVGWRFDRSDGSQIILVGESHVATPIESNPVRTAAIRNYIDGYSNIAIEDFSIHEANLMHRCEDEEPSLIESPAVSASLERWLNATQSSEEVLPVIRAVGGDFARYTYLIGSTSVYAADLLKIPNERRPTLGKSPFIEMIEQASSAHNKITVRKLESFNERALQWCSAPRGSREDLLSLEFDLATAWLTASRLTESVGSDFKQVVIDGAQGGYLFAWRCADATEVCKLESARGLDWKDRLKMFDSERADVLLGQRNKTMVRRAIRYMTDGSLILVVGAAHLPTFQVRGELIYGMIDLFRQQGFRATPLYLCGDVLCERPAPSDILNR